MELFFSNNSRYNLRNNSDFKGFSTRNVLCCNETVLSLARKIWNLLALDTKNATSITEFKKEIRSWSTTDRLFLQT